MRAASMLLWTSLPSYHSTSLPSYVESIGGHCFQLFSSISSLQSPHTEPSLTMQYGCDSKVLLLLHDVHATSHFTQLLVIHSNDCFPRSRSIEFDTCDSSKSHHPLHSSSTPCADNNLTRFHFKRGSSKEGLSWSKWPSFNPSSCLWGNEILENENAYNTSSCKNSNNTLQYDPEFHLP